jgi:carboxyl-terminal processing protease
VAVLAVALLGSGAALDRAGVLGGPAAEATPPAAEDFSLIRQAWDLLHEKYVGAANLDEKQLAYGAIEGMTQAVDDPGHTSFETPEELAQSHAALSGSYVGIGVQLDVKDTGPVIVTVFRKGPAATAGLLPGDRITAVDGTDVTKLDIDKVAALVRGDEGTKVTITVERDGRTSPLTVTLTRSKIDLPAVDWAPIPGTNLAMLRLESFTSGSADELKAALTEILASHPSGLVFDLRGNGGGYINEAISIASQFLTSGNVHLSRDAQGNVTPTAVEPGGLAPKIPMVVLVDAGTASSAEIVTGALQDAHRATIVGQRTFGTGTVLSEQSLSDGSALRIGVIEWLTPNGRSIWREGLEPDVSVALPAGVLPLAPADLRSLDAKQIKARDDTQLQKAIDILDDVPVSAQIGTVGTTHAIAE